MSTLDALITDSKFVMPRWSKGDEARYKAFLRATDRFLKSKKYETRRTYVPAIKQFFTMFSWICPENITVLHAQQFKTSLLAQGKKETTALWRVAAMSSFMKFLKKEGLVKNNPFREIDRADINPEIYKTQKIISVKDVLNALKNKPHDVKGLRDRAILAFVLFTQCNREELSNLRVRDLKEDKVLLHCSQQEREIDLPKPVRQAVEDYWLASGRKLDPDSGVFTAASERRIALHRKHNKKKEDPISHDRIRNILKPHGSVREIKKIRSALRKKLRTIERYNKLPEVPTYTEVKRIIPDQSLIQAYVRLLEIEEITGDL